MVSLWKLATLLETGIKNKIIHCVLELNQSQWTKQHLELNNQKQIDNESKDEKALYKLEYNAIFKKQWKTSEIDPI